MRLVVVDASALVEFLLRTPRGQDMENVLTDPDTDLHVPALCDVEVAAALRRLVLTHGVGEERAVEALTDHADLPLHRHGHEALLLRLFELRANFSAYDATYVALAEALGGALLTADAGLGRAVRRHADISLEVALPPR